MADKRDQAFPEIPTAIEQGVDWSSIGWRGFATQRDVPTNIVQILTRHLTEIATSEDYIQFMEEQGFAIDVKVGADFETFLERQDEQWKSVLEYYVKQ
jgi:putative tricarboxylic transport membrane protein